MTKEITKAVILQEMQDKLKLREFTPANFLFEETVVPVYDIEQHLEHPTTTYAEVSITSASFFLFFEIPPNEIWYLDTYNVIFMGAGAIAVTGLYISRKIRSPSDAVIYLDMELGQTVSYTVNLSKAVKLLPGDKLYVYVDTYTSTQALRLYIDYVKEEIR